MVASLSTVARAGRTVVTSTPQWPWSVYSSRHRSASEHEVVADLVAQVAQGELHDAVGSPGARALGILRRGHAEEDHAGDAEGGELGDLLAQRLAGVLHDARQRRDRLRLVDAFAHEQRRDEVVDGQSGLGGHAPEGGRSPQPPQPALGECHRTKANGPARRRALRR